MSCGCGARTSLLEGGGGASASASDASAQASTGATGGHIRPCGGKLAAVDPVVTLEQAPGFDDSIRLTFASNDQQTVAPVFAHLPPSGPVVLRHAAFSPWQAWPTSGVLGPVRDTGVSTESGPFVAPAADGTFALALGTPAGHVAFYGAVNPFANGPGAAAPLAVDGIDPEFVVARAGPSSAAHLVGAFGDFSTLYAEVASDTVSAGVPLGCAAPQPTSAAAVPFGDGWLVAASTGAPLGACPSVAAGDPTRIDVLAIGLDGSAQPIASIPTDIVVSVAAAPHPDGAYVVWLGVSSTGAADYHAARIGAAEAPVAGPIAVTPSDMSGGAFAVATLGRDLVFGRVGASGELLLSRFDESLSLRSTTSFQAGAFSGPTAILASPDEDAILVAWTATEQPSKVQVERFDCMP